MRISNKSGQFLGVPYFPLAGNVLTYNFITRALTKKKILKNKNCIKRNEKLPNENCFFYTFILIDVHSY